MAETSVRGKLCLPMKRVNDARIQLVMAQIQKINYRKPKQTD